MGYDYVPLPPTRRAADVVKAPAILLLVVSGFNLLCQLVGLIIVLAGEAPWAVPDASPEAGRLGEILTSGLGLLLFLSGAAASTFVIIAAGRMLQLRNWGLAMTGSIVATSCLIPWVCCCCLPIGFPFGIFAIVILLDPEVKAAFR